MTLAQAPRGLQAAVRKTLGLLAVRPGPRSGPAGGDPPHRAPAYTVPAIPRGARFLAPAAGRQPLRLDFTLRPRDPAGLQALALAVSTPGSPQRRHFLTVPQFAARFGQSPQALGKAETALREVGLSPGRVASNGLLIPVVTTIGQAAAALHTGFADYRLRSGRVAFANTSAPRLPRPVAAITAAVVGLNNLVVPGIGPPRSRPLSSGGHSGRARRRPTARPAAGPGPAPCPAATQAATTYGGWTYDQLASAYSLTSLYNQGAFGGGSTIALFEQDPYLMTDIQG
jgi:kumamolisin